MVLTVLALLVAFSITPLLRSRMNAAEVIVLAGCQTIGKGCQNFYSNTLPHAYPGQLSQLSSGNLAYIDPVLGGGQKQGYRFVYTQLDPHHFQLQAQPITPGWHGNRFFFLDQSGVLRVRDGAPAGPADSPIGD